MEENKLWVKDNSRSMEEWMFLWIFTEVQRKNSLFILYNFLFIIFLRFEQCSTKFNLLSIVTPKSLKLFTTLTLISSFLSLTSLVATVISFGNLTLLLVTNMKKVLDQLMSSLLNWHQSRSVFNLFRCKSFWSTVF